MRNRPYSRKRYRKVCKYRRCGKPFDAVRSDSNYCSNMHRKMESRLRTGRRRKPDGWVNRLAKVEAERDALRDALAGLMEYAGCLSTCENMRHSAYPCDCGSVEAYNNAEAALGKEKP